MMHRFAYFGSILRLISIFPAVFALLLSVSAEAAVPDIEPKAPDQLTDEEMAEIVDFIVGNAVFTLYHQAGHMMAMRHGLGPADEDAADRFAAITLLEPRSGAGDQTLVDAIDSYRLAAHQQDAAAGGRVSLPDVHSVDEARASAIACDMVGADPAGFSDIAEAMGLPAQKRAACAEKWREAVDQWKIALKSVLRPAGGTGAALPIAYDPPIDQDIAEATILEDNHVLEEVAAKLGATYDFASPPKVRAMHCGEETSRYDADRNELVLCYELSAYHGQLILRDIESRG